MCGTVYYFLRVSKEKAIAIGNIANDICFGLLDASSGKLIDAVEKMVSKIYLPCLTTLEEWGALKTVNNSQAQDYIETLENFLVTINDLKSDMNNQVKLEASENDAALCSLSSFSDFQNMSNNNEFLAQCEELLGHWCKQIAKVLIESEQIRREADDTGPYSKLAYWKQRMAKFNNLLEQIKSQRVKAVVGILRAGKSKSLNTWKEMDARITDAANESRDNVKYLYTLDKFFGTMTKSPVINN